MTAPRKGKIIDPMDQLSQAAGVKVEDVEPEADEATEEAQAADDQETVASDDVVDDSDDDDATEEDDYIGVEQMEDQEELFPGGPRGMELKAWKKQFGEIFVTSFDSDLHVVWRPLTRFEYRRLVKNLEQAVSSGAVSQAEANLNNEESICEMTVLWPQISRTDNANHLAGLHTVIASEVMEASAFVPLEVRKL